MVGGGGRAGAACPRRRPTACRCGLRAGACGGGGGNPDARSVASGRARPAIVCGGWMGMGRVSGCGACGRGRTCRGRRPTGGGRGGRWCVALASPPPPRRLPGWLCCTRTRGSVRPALGLSRGLGGHRRTPKVTMSNGAEGEHRNSGMRINRGTYQCHADGRGATRLFVGVAPS